MNSSSSSKQSAPARKSKGRQKVKMVKMENHSNLQVTFSKRRAGLFKKASELCTLCGAEAAIVVFSPANKVYCFGHPSVEDVVDRLSAPPPPTHLLMEAHRNSNIRDLNIDLTRLETMLRSERARAGEIDRITEAGRQKGWLPASLDGLDHAQLGALKERVAGFKKELDDKMQKEMVRVSESSQSQRLHCHSGDPLFAYPTLSLGFDHLLPYSTMSNEGYYHGWSGGGGGVFDGSNGASSSTLPNHMFFPTI
ncbi:agamous-like MADS-box protein AGL62 [Salvia hispanica]|uniref:agamous-like MADS-box protein AGL62 n=1 Tax=Salvia hispanica TaxID=49212 RepID=UPI0020093C36|nr:agamous-like MADS-box protein AGL62 [Salvia hispanica]